MLVPLAVALCALGVWAIAASGPGVDSIAIGTCVQTGARGRIASVPCEQPHTGQVAGVFSLSPGRAKRSFLDQCRSLISDQVVPAEASDLGLAIIPELRGGSETGTLLCVLASRTEKYLTGSVLQ